MTKWKLHACSLLILAFFTLLATGSTDSDSPSTPGANSGSGGAAQTSESPDITISAADLVQAYKDNEVAADQRFKGKILLVSGVVDTIGKDIMDTPYISLRSNEEFSLRNVQAMFPRSAEGRLASVSKGSSVVIQGRCDGMFGNILIRNSILK